MISARHVTLRTVFYRFYDVICRYRVVSGTRVEQSESIFLLKHYYLLVKKRLRKFNPQLFNFPDFQPGQLLSICLGFNLDLSLRPQQLGCSKKKQRL